MPSLMPRRSGEKDVGIDGMYAVCTPEAYFAITSSSRAINADFNGAGGGNGTIANGVTAQVLASLCTCLIM